MELKTISELRALNIDVFSAYRDEVVNACNGTYFTPLETSCILKFLYHTDFALPAPLYVRNYVMAFLVEHFEDILYKCHTLTEANVVSDNTDCWVFLWKMGRNTSLIVLEEEDKTFMLDTLTALDAGVTLDWATGITIPLLEEDTASMAEWRDMLRILGVVANPIEVIPPISDTLSIDESTARFSSAMWFEEIQKKTIILAGLGGIGSYVAFLLARMHPRSMFLYDDDTVEVVNMAGQLYCTTDVSRYKVDAIADTIRKYSSYSSVFAVREKFTENTEAANIMICGFDSMEARKIFFSKWVAHVMDKPEEDRKHCLFIDGRLAAEELQVLCIRGEDEYNIARYRDVFLFSDEEADETLCSYKQTTYMANMIGSIIVNLFTNFVANELVEGLRDLPFLTSYSAESMMFKTEQ